MLNIRTFLNFDFCECLSRRESMALSSHGNEHTNEIVFGQNDDTIIKDVIVSRVHFQEDAEIRLYHL